MPPNDGEGESASFYKSSSEDKDPCTVNQEQESDNKEDEVDANASQVTFDTMGTSDPMERGRGGHMRASCCLLRGGISYCSLCCLVVSWLVSQSLGSLGPLIVKLFGAQSFSLWGNQVLKSVVHRLVVSHWSLSLLGYQVVKSIGRWSG